MSEYAKNTGVIALFILFFYIDLIFQGRFAIFDYVYLSLVFIILIYFSKLKINKNILFFIAGIGLDWYARNYIGLTSLLLVSLNILFEYIRFRIADNRLGNYIVVMIMSYFLYYIWQGHEGLFAIRNILFSLIVISVYPLTILKQRY